MIFEGQEIILFDFEDSFTHNIASEIYSFNKDLAIIHYSYFDSVIDQVDPDEKKIFILGPGPGSPQQYFKNLSKLDKLIKTEKWTLLGICLGHQIILSFLGFKLRRCIQPVHGQSLEVRIPSWPIFEKAIWNKEVMAQYYNSLAIEFKKTDKDDWSFCVNESQEIVMSYNENKKILTYQFHPESVGTSYPQIFFAPLQKI